MGVTSREVDYYVAFDGNWCLCFSAENGRRVDAEARARAVHEALESARADDCIVAAKVEEAETLAQTEALKRQQLQAKVGCQCLKVFPCYQRMQGADGESLPIELRLKCPSGARCRTRTDPCTTSF